MEGGWTEVRRKRKPAANNAKIITYFVTNVPGETRKGELRKTFERFGNITDIYMGQKLGKNGKHYAFVRFKGVGDTKDLERRLDGLKLKGDTLRINIALHERKEPPKQHRDNETGNRVMGGHPYRNNKGEKVTRIGSWNRDHRTYADLLRPRYEAKSVNYTTEPPGPPLPVPITLQQEQVTLSWLR